MTMLLKLLIRVMKTMDGSRNSAKPLLDALNKQEIEKYQYKVSNGTILDEEVQKIKQLNEHKFYNKILMKYKIMKVRAKISYIACLKYMTITELIVR